MLSSLEICIGIFLWMFQNIIHRNIRIYIDKEKWRRRRICCWMSHHHPREQVTGFTSVKCVTSETEWRLLLVMHQQKMNYSVLADMASKILVSQPTMEGLLTWDKIHIQTKESASSLSCGSSHEQIFHFCVAPAFSSWDSKIAQRLFYMSMMWEEMGPRSSQAMGSARKLLVGLWQTEHL